ncbi:L,D-transpeptidase [Pseudomonas sp. UL073]|uniref:L,D-transpeptidase n=1 Tax=Zestomonas insulae TaxID=2809017 RepID=A0ABS2IB63_9GAMM|nr:L,D-transpeptidase [Pseudomonas insulae]MBM7060369.1 L,D-transpeptidase [Pseudomonas insulae]
MKQLLVALTLIFATLSVASPLQAPTTDELRSRLNALKPGQFLWLPQVSPQGPVTVVVSLTEQRAYVYRNGVAIGVSTVSTGKHGHDTPTGVFTILQKSVNHHSDLYNSAPMPYMQRLTWDGIALHAGNLPGYPASHGCVRMPAEFAKKLYAITGFSTTTVVISDVNSAPVEVYHPGLIAPLVGNGKVEGAPLVAGDSYLNDPGEAKGPLSILISRADLRAYVFRGGQLIGAAPVVAQSASQRHGMAVFSLLQKPTATEFDPAPPLRWSAVQLSNPEFGSTPQDQLGQISVDPEFLRKLHQAMDVGTTLAITDLRSTQDTRSDGHLTVISTDEADKVVPSVKK